MDEQELAQHLRKVSHDLNRAIQACANAGLRVEIKLDVFQQYGRPDCPLVTISSISKEIGRAD